MDFSILFILLYSSVAAQAFQALGLFYPEGGIY